MYFTGLETFSQLVYEDEYGAVSLFLVFLFAYTATWPV